MRRLLVGLLCLLWPTVGVAQTSHSYTPTHYVDIAANVGAVDDATDQGATAWASATSRETAVSLGTMTARASAGNIVELAPGVYSRAGTGTGSGSPCWSFRQGTSGNPIIYTARYPAAINAAEYRTKLRDTNQPSGEVAPRPVLAVSGHTIIDGLWFDDTDGGKPSSRGTVYNVFGVTDNTYLRMRFDRTAADQYGSGRPNDNFNAIQGHGNTNITIRNSLFIGGRTTSISPNRNYAFITWYGTFNYLIEHNRFQDCESAIFQKGSAGSTNGGPDGIRGNYGTVRFNEFINCQRGPHLGEQEDAGPATLFYQNVIYHTEAIFSPQYDFEFDNSVGSRNVNNQVYSNTIVMHPNSAAGGITSQGGNAHTNSLVRDNLVVAPASNTQVLVNFASVPTAMSAFDYNWYWNSGETLRWSEGTIRTSLAAWQSAMSPFEANATTGDPQFVDANAYNFRLAPGSPARTAGSTGGPVGAYITGDEVIGPTEAQAGGPTTSYRRLFRMKVGG